MYGTNLRTLDEKNRLAIPSIYRQELGNVFYISLSLDQVLEIRSAEEFDKIKNKISQANSLNKNIRNFARFFFSNTTQVSPDKQGRVLLPKNLIELSAIQNKELILVGVGKKLEIWPKDRFNQLQSQFQDADNIEILEKELLESGVEL
ncbi:transcriptional regulator MraZ [Mycoplasma hyorhinis]|uniref:division/cell wall cluster transcriptional repressor MraZ n=1 Tax=Mesomycoplasma hyorhinis TaxID=2100 RepID=UPI00136C7E9C|nr:division/cell wall cluster transcriptional repressor MraZ [Mesomycoplasma hyorhinis]MXR06473.1 transcriptional regulator MraZ [Mesomycoplasma hyorhinis]MXR07993.1 transcriptional regulator MraZ [Mesomycoplasma hyorhinis]